MEKQNLESQNSKHAEQHLEDLEKQVLTTEPALFQQSQEKELFLPRSAVCYPICSIFWCLCVGCFTMSYYNQAKKAAEKNDVDALKRKSASMKRSTIISIVVGIIMTVIVILRML